MPLPEPGTHQTAGCKAEQAGHQLLGAPLAVVHLRVEGVQPSIDTVVHMREHAASDDRTRSKRENADDDPALPAGRHIQHAYEHREEHERRTQITLNHQHTH